MHDQQHERERRPEQPPARAADPGPGAVLQLQRSAGNAAVSGLLDPAARPVVQREPAAPGQAATAPAPAQALPAERQGFINLCGAATNWVASQSHFAEAFAENIGAAYSDAHGLYSKAVEQASASSKMVDEMILDACLTFVPGGKGVKGVLSAAMGTGDHFIIEGAKDIAATNADKFVKMGLQGELAGKFGPIESPPPVNQTPAAFRVEVVNRVHEVVGNIHATLGGWILAANDPASKADFTFDPLTLVRKAFKIEGVEVGPGLKPPPNAALLFEKGMWKKHITTQTLTEEEHHRENESGERDERMGPGASVHTGGYKISRKLKQRIEACAAALGEKGEDWLRDWGVEMKQDFHSRTGAGETERWHPDQWF